MNNFSAIGSLGQDCETRFTNSGTAIVSFSVAITSGWGNNKKTTWVNCSLWGKKDGTPPPVAQFLVKGQKVGITGEITLREWESKGKSGTSLDCNVKDLTLCGEKKAGQATPAPSDGRPAKHPSQPAADNSMDDFDQDIPF